MSSSWWLEARYNKKPHPQAVRRPHAFKPVNGLPKPMCNYCGMLALNNDASRYFAKQGCWKFPDEK